MAFMGKQNDIDLTLINAAIKGNEERKNHMYERILNSVKDIKNPKIAILALLLRMALMIVEKVLP